MPPLNMASKTALPTASTNLASQRGRRLPSARPPAPATGVPRRRCGATRPSTRRRQPGTCGGGRLWKAGALEQGVHRLLGSTGRTSDVTRPGQKHRPPSPSLPPPPSAVSGALAGATVRLQAGSHAGTSPEPARREPRPPGKAQRDRWGQCLQAGLVPVRSRGGGTGPPEVMRGPAPHAGVSTRGGFGPRHRETPGEDRGRDWRGRLEPRELEAGRPRSERGAAATVTSDTWPRSGGRGLRVALPAHLSRGLGRTGRHPSPR